MIVLGIESSCDECSVAIVRDGEEILANIVATQIEEHLEYQGVVPEIASRLHAEWIVPVYRDAIKAAGIKPSDIDAVAVTARPGLVGSLMVGVCFAKSLAWSLGVPLVGVDHILGHLYAPNLQAPIAYPALGVLVSGGHTIICSMKGVHEVEVLGTTLDDAVGEAFDKVAKHYNWGYPGGVIIDKMAQEGDATAFAFPVSNLAHKGHTYDVSYSGLKTAVAYQRPQFLKHGDIDNQANIAASFQKAAIETMMLPIMRALEDTGHKTLIVGGGVAANSYFRKRLSELEGVDCFFPSLSLCTDNAAMIAGYGYHCLLRGDRSDLSLRPEPRIMRFQKKLQKDVQKAAQK